MKVCSKCNQEKSLTEFYKHPHNRDGLSGQCKKCKNIYTSNYIKTHRVQFNISCAKWKRKQSIEYHTKIKRTHRKNNPLKYKARTMITNLLVTGKLKKQPCEECGSNKSQAHHDDYSKPLEIKWLCRNHHLQIHGYLKEAKDEKRKDANICIP